jgi:Zn-finger protein
MTKDCEPYVCDICKGNHYFIDEDGNVNQCPECTAQGHVDEQEDIPNETRS